MVGNSLEVDLYLAYTPYNVFIATLLAMRNSPTRASDLFLSPAFDCSAPLVRCLQSSKYSPFRKVRLLGQSIQSDPLPHRVMSQSWNAHMVRNQVRRGRYRQVFAANPRRPETQAALYALHQSRGDTSAFIIDEGLHSYSWEYFQLPSGYHWKLIRKLFYGVWYHDLPGRRVSISIPWCDAKLLLFPEMMADVVTANEFAPIAPPNANERTRLGEFSIDYVAEYGLSGRLLGSVRHLIFARHSSYLNRHVSYVARLREIAQQKRNGVAIKLHPRDPSPDPFNFKQLRNAMELPRQLGSEFLLMHPSMQPESFSGDLTSALVTARWLYPEAEIRLIDTNDLSADEGIRRLLQTTLMPGLNGVRTAG